MLDVQRAGAVAAIVFNSEPSGPFIMPASTAAPEAPSIPATSVGHNAGEACERAALTGYGCFAHIYPVRLLLSRRNTVAARLPACIVTWSLSVQQGLQGAQAQKHCARAGGHDECACRGTPPRWTRCLRLSQRH